MNTSASKSFSLVQQFPEYLTGIDEQVLADWQAFRAKKKYSTSATVFKGLVREATAAGMTLTAAMAMMIEREWRGFKADWALNIARKTHQGTNQNRHTGFNESKYEELKNGSIPA